MVGDFDHDDFLWPRNCPSSPCIWPRAYAAIANGGTRVEPTLLKRDRPQYGARVMSERSAAAARDMLRKVVTEGTASFGEVPGYAVAGKTGTPTSRKSAAGVLQGQGDRDLCHDLSGA